MNSWAIICEESDLPGLWRRWQSENVVTISFGTPEFLSEHSELSAPNAAWGFARARVMEMEPGDIIVPFLRQNRIGRVAHFRGQKVDQWNPIIQNDHGRLIEVTWQVDGMPPADKVALIPRDIRRPVRRTVSRLDPDWCKQLLDVLADAENWQDLPVVQEADEDEDEIEPVDSARFALEKHLEEFIEANFSRIDFGRHIELFQNDQSSGRQFPTTIGTIDLLATDLETGEFVVIELKKNRSDDAVVGQILRYMGWVSENLDNGRGRVSGVIIVPESSDRLRYALKMVPNVSVFTYSVSFGLAKDA